MKNLIGITLLGAVGLTGCASVNNLYDPVPLLDEPYSLTIKGALIIDDNVLKERISEVTGKAERNKLFEEILTISDKSCAFHQRDIIANANKWNIATGSITNLFSGLGTVVGGETAKASLAAVAALSSATRSLVNEEVYARSIGPTIVQAIVVAREKQVNVIKTNMKNELADYSIQQGIREIQEYHRRCSFYWGMIEISKALENRKITKYEIDQEIDALETYVRAAPDGRDMSNIEKKIEELILKRDDAPN